MKHMKNEGTYPPATSHKPIATAMLKGTFHKTRIQLDGWDKIGSKNAHFLGYSAFPKTRI